MSTIAISALQRASDGDAGRGLEMSHLMTTADLPPMARPNLGTVFLAAARSEWTKPRTVRSTVWALIFTVLTIVGIGRLLTALEVSRWNQRSLTEITGFDPILFSFAGLDLAQLSIVVLGVLVMTSEYATGGIKLTFGATPQRILLLAAKVTTFCVVVTIVTVVSRLAAFLISQGLLALVLCGYAGLTPWAPRLSFVDAMPDDPAAG